MKKIDVQELEEKRAENRLNFLGVHSGFHKGKFKMDIYRSNGLRKGVRTTPIHYFIPKNDFDRQSVMERIRKAKDKIKERESIIG
jgi:hypothetical protein